ncbi:MAG: chemotaxis protein CheW [Candidatus Nitrospinota bacterium M3_3B_026]
MDKKPETGSPLGRDPLGEPRDSVWKTPGGQAPEIMGGRSSSDDSVYVEPPWTPVDTPLPPAAQAGQDVEDASAVKEKTEPGRLYLGVVAAGELYGLDAMDVREIVRTKKITRAPRTNQSVLGVMSLRGAIVPVISMRLRFGFPRAAASKSSRIIVLDMAEGPVGLMADAVTDLFRLPESAIEKPPEGAADGVDYVFGVGRAGERLIALLDTERALKLH